LFKSEVSFSLIDDEFLKSEAFCSIVLNPNSLGINRALVVFPIPGNPDRRTALYLRFSEN
jgi:hypothetical protein